MDLLFILSGEHEPLAKTECQAKNPSATDWRAIAQAVICSTDKPEYEGLACTKQVHEVLLQGKPEAISLERPRPTDKKVSVECIRLDKRKTPTSAEARKLLIPWLKRPKVDLEHPEETYALITAKEEWYVTRRVWKNEEDFSARKNQHRPAPHPTSLDPKLARAMINLAGKTETILDPFCGSGGILIEASLLDKRTTGIDIDPAMIARAKKNLEAFGAEAKLMVGDATATKEKADAIVTDLPYGRNSKAKDLEQLYKAFLKNAKQLTSTLIIAFPDLVDGEALLKGQGWDIKDKFTQRLHNTLKKELFIASIG